MEAAALKHTFRQQGQTEAEAYLRSVAQRSQRVSPVAVRTRLVVNQSASMGIIDVAHAEGADLLALTTHGRGRLLRLLLGSVADKVLRGSRIPVLNCRPTTS